MKFITAVWGEEYAAVGRGLIRSFGRYCTSHRLVVHTDVPELLPDQADGRNSIYVVDNREDWLRFWPGYYQTAGREMVVRMSLMQYHLGQEEQQTVWVDSDLLVLDDPAEDLQRGRDLKVVVHSDGGVSAGFWAASELRQMARLRNWAIERTKGQDFTSETLGPVLRTWWRTRRRVDVKKVNCQKKLYELGHGAQARLRPGGDIPELLRFDRGAFMFKGGRVETLRLSRALIEEHQRTGWRAFRDDNVRQILWELYAG